MKYVDMYNLRVSTKLVESLRSGKFSEVEGIKNRLGKLQNNPKIEGKKLNAIDGLGDYYSRGGNKYSIIFNIDDDGNNVEIVNIVRRELLYRLINNANN